MEIFEVSYCFLGPLKSKAPRNTKMNVQLVIPDESPVFTELRHAKIYRASVEQLWRQINLAIEARTNLKLVSQINQFR